MAVATPIPFVKARFFDRCGNVLAGGKVYTYEPHSTTPKVTYTAPISGTPNTNPIVLDAAGEANIYLAGRYRIIVTDSKGVVVNDNDDVGSWYSGDLDSQLESVNQYLDDSGDSLIASQQARIDAMVNSGLVGAGSTDLLVALSDGSGRTQRDKNNERVSIKDFGGIGDGLSHTVQEWINSGKYENLAAIQAIYPHVTATTDSIDWAALQAAVNSVALKGGGEVYLPTGTWRMSAPIYGATNVSLVGAGKRATIILAEVSTRWANRHLFYAQNCSNFIIKNLTIDQNGRNRGATTATGASLIINNVIGGGVFDVRFLDASSVGTQASMPMLLIVAKDADDDSTWLGSVIGGVSEVTVTGCDFIMPDTEVRCGFAIRMLTDWEKLRPQDQFINRIKGCNITQNTFNGSFFWNHIELAGGGTQHNNINFNNFTGVGLTAIDFDKGTSFNTALCNTVDGWGFPTNLSNDNNVRLAILSDHGNEAGYRNKGNAFIRNIIKNVQGKGGQVYEALIAVQYVDSSLVSQNQLHGLNNASAGCAILIDSNASNLIIEKNQIDGVRNGVASSASTINSNNIRLIENDILAANNCYNLAGVTGARNQNWKISGGEAVTTSTTALNTIFAAGGVFADVVVENAVLRGGGDCLSVGATSSVINANVINGAATRSIRITEGKAIISKNRSINPAVGDYIIGVNASIPLLDQNDFRLDRLPIETWASAIPTRDTWNVGDTVKNTNPTTSSAQRWICTTSGTAGTLTSGITVNGTAGTNTVTVNNATALQVGDYVTFAGGAKTRITKIVDNVCTVSPQLASDLSNAVVAYVAPVFSAYSGIVA